MTDGEARRLCQGLRLTFLASHVVLLLGADRRVSKMNGDDVECFSQGFEVDNVD